MLFGKYDLNIKDSVVMECDTDKNGSLDTTEFATGMAGKYEIQWAQVCISSSLPSGARFILPVCLFAQDSTTVHSLTNS